MLNEIFWVYVFVYNINNFMEEKSNIFMIEVTYTLNGTLNC